MSDKPITLEEVKILQLDVLQAVHDFCQDRRITYSLACGTMLGAIRHKGYIPWDDDIDIYLLRDDYMRLVKEFPQQLGNCFELVSMERNLHWDRPYAKAYNNRTIVMENAYCNIRIGVGIDIYPIDDVPDEEVKWRRYDKLRRILQNALSIKSIRIQKGRGFLKNTVIFFLKVPLLFISRRRFSEFVNNYSQKNNNRGYHSVFECAQGLLQKTRFNKLLFNSIALYPFEDYVFCGFSDYDSYLRCAYGDYMKLPPEEKRHSEHMYSCWRK